jgi:hypothetical protein
MGMVTRFDVYLVVLDPTEGYEIKGVFSGVQDLSWTSTFGN